MQNTPLKQKIILCTNFILALIILFVDYITPLGIAGGVPYVLCILITLTIQYRYISLYFAILTSLFTLIIAFSSISHAASLEVILLNRLYSLFAIWASAIIIHYKKHSDIKAKEADLNYLQMIESLPVALLIGNKEGNVVFVNENAEQLFRYSKGELKSQAIESLIPLLSMKKYVNFDDKPSHRDAVMVDDDRELFILNASNDEVPVEISLIPLSLGGIQHILITIIDISLRIEAQKKLTQYNMELQRSNNELSDFAYIASHDLKEPLRGIHNYSKFIIEDYADNIDAQGKRMLNMLSEQANRLELIIDTLLKYSRFGRLEMNVEEVNLQSVVDEVLTAIQYSIEEKKVSVSVPKQLPETFCDRVFIGEVFHNLISNAIKFTNEENPFIEIGYYLDNGIIIYVKDNGIGIKKHHNKHVFKLFKRLHAKDKFGGGSGAGLTIVKKIIDRHNGEVWFESEEGQGSTFFFKLPSQGI